MSERLRLTSDTYGERKAELRSVIERASGSTDVAPSHEADESYTVKHLFADLLARVRGTATPANKVMVAFIESTDPARLAKALHFTREGEQALLGDTDKLEVDAQGRLLFHSGDATRILMRQSGGEAQIVQVYSGDYQEASA